MLFILLLICLGIYKKFNGVKEESGNLNYKILYKQKTCENKDYVIFSDEKYKYTISENPKNVYLVISTTNEITNNDFAEAKKNFDNGLYNFYYNNKIVIIYDIEYALYANKILISDIINSPELKIKRTVNNINFSLNDYKISKVDDSDKKLYYQDKFGVKLYVQNMDSIKVKINDNYQELSDVLSQYDEITNNIYVALLKTENTICSGTETYKLTGTCGKSLRIDICYENNEVYYLMYPFTIKYSEYRPQN